MKTFKSYINEQNNKFNIFDELKKLNIISEEHEILEQVLFFYKNNKKMLIEKWYIKDYKNYELEKNFKTVPSLMCGFCLVFAVWCKNYMPYLNIKFILDIEEDGEEYFELGDFDKWVETGEHYDDGSISLHHALLEYNGIFYDSIYPQGLNHWGSMI